VENANEQQKPLVLIADDDEIIRMMAAEALQEGGFATETVENGQLAVTAFLQLLPEIVLLDVNMPIMDGFAACAEIRKSPAGDRVPILMLTGLEDIDSITRAYDTGATDFQSKPVNWIILRQRIRYMLRASDTFEAMLESESKNRELLVEQRQSAQALHRERDFIATVLDTARALVMVRDRQGRIVRFNRACEEATGYDSNDVARKRVWDFLLIPEEVGRDKAVFEELRAGREANEYQSYWVTKDGRQRLISWSNSVLLDRSKEVEHVISTSIDITERKQAEEQVQFLAYYDGLTSLPNRVLFKENLNQALAYSQRHERLMTLLFLDLDRFKQINDTFGHSLGDLLLKGIAERLRSDVRIGDCVARREANDLESSVGRFGGDEFTLLITDVSSVQAAAKIAQRVLDLIAEPFELDNQEVYITASIGISMHPHDGANAEVLLKNADAAMYAAKEHGRNGYSFYTPSMNSKTFTKLSLENDLRKAIGREEFVVYYQPKLDVSTGRVIGVEALLRWRHPSKGLLSPAEFIPLAEETGLIMPLGDWGLRTVCLQNLEWQKKGVPPLPIAVNLSCIQFRQKDLHKTIYQTLLETELDPRLLELEITESTIMQNEEEAGRTLRKLKEMGIRISIDDFGTGYSSLGYLKRFTLDALKIDRSFVKDLTSDADDRAITIAIIAMAHSLGLKVVAEGVETQQQLAFLRENGCDEVQGYLFSPPLSEADIAALLNSDSLLELARHFETCQPSYSS